MYLDVLAPSHCEEVRGDCKAGTLARSMSVAIQMVDLHLRHPKVELRSLHVYAGEASSDYPHGNRAADNHVGRGALVQTRCHFQCALRNRIEENIPFQALIVGIDAKDVT